MRWMRQPTSTPIEPRTDDRKVEFVAYATDCVVVGRVALPNDRLTDLLTGQDEYDLEAVSVEVLAEERVVVLDSTKVLREDLCVVATAGPRGNPARRVRTRPHPIRLAV